MEKTIELTCDTCGKQFHKRRAEHNRCLKRGHKRKFCSLKCCGKATIDNIPPESKVWDHLVANNKSDEYSPFRWHYRNAKRRKHEFDLTLEYLKELWEKQDGKCPYTDWPLKQMKDTSHKNQLPTTPDRTSLDRIDSSKGYVKGNVQFICYMAQNAKNKFTSAQLKSFCESMVVHCKNKYWVEDTLADTTLGGFSGEAKAKVL